MFDILHSGGDACTRYITNLLTSVLNLFYNLPKRLFLCVCQVLAWSCMVDGYSTSLCKNIFNNNEFILG